MIPTRSADALLTFSFAFSASWCCDVSCLEVERSGCSVRSACRRENLSGTVTDCRARPGTAFGSTPLGFSTYGAAARAFSISVTHDKASSVFLA